MSQGEELTLEGCPDIILYQVIGEGGFGTVWKGFDKKTGRIVAVKRQIPVTSDSSTSSSSLNNSLADDSQVKSPLLKEKEHLQRLISLQHGPDASKAVENVVHFYGYVPSPPAIIMEFVEGGSVFNLIAKSRFRLHESVVWKYAKDVLSGMYFLVTKNGGMVHGDLNPGNFLISADGTVKLADFGCTVQYSALIRENSLGDVSKDQAVPAASYQYSSREILAGEITGPNLPSDMWSFACSVIHMLTGNYPWVNEEGKPLNQAQVWRRLQEGAAPPIPPHCSRVLAKILTRCLNVADPRQRPIPSEVLFSPYFKTLDLSVMEKKSVYNEARRKHLNLPENDPVLEEKGKRYYEPENADFVYGERRRLVDDEEAGAGQGTKSPPPQPFVKEPSATQIADPATTTITLETTWKFERNGKWERYSVSDSKIISRAFLEYKEFVSSGRALGKNDEAWWSDGILSFTHCWGEKMVQLQMDFNRFTQKVVGSEAHERLRPAPEEVTLIG